MKPTYIQLVTSRRLIVNQHHSRTYISWNIPTYGKLITSWRLEVGFTKRCQRAARTSEETQGFSQGKAHVVPPNRQRHVQQAAEPWLDQRDRPDGLVLEEVVVYPLGRVEEPDAVWVASVRNSRQHLQKQK